MKKSLCKLNSCNGKCISPGAGLCACDGKKQMKQKSESGEEAEASEEKDTDAAKCRYPRRWRLYSRV